MSDYSALTKAELLMKLGEIDEKYRALREERQAPREEVRRVPEADALAACVRALDALKESHSSSAYDISKHSDNERVLRLLAARYNVNLFEVRYEPAQCQRVHLEDVDLNQFKPGGSMFFPLAVPSERA